MSGIWKIQDLPFNDREIMPIVPLKVLLKSWKLKQSKDVKLSFHHQRSKIKQWPILKIWTNSSLILSNLKKCNLKSVKSALCTEILSNGLLCSIAEILWLNFDNAHIYYTIFVRLVWVNVNIVFLSSCSVFKVLLATLCVSFLSIHLWRFCQPV